MIKLRRQHKLRKKVAEELGFAVECWVLEVVQQAKDNVEVELARGLGKRPRRPAVRHPPQASRPKTSYWEVLSQAFQARLVTPTAAAIRMGMAVPR